MADHQRYLFQLFLLISSCFVLSSYAFQFNVGGRQGWVVNPDENYNDWAGRLRFLINDTLLFKYSQGDSVLVVNKDDYDKCNTDKPIMKFYDGNSIFKLDRSGPFYFISGNKANCEKGQKLIVVVISMRNLSPLPSPTGQSPMPSPPTGPSPISPSPSPSGGSTTPPLSPAPALSPTATPPSVVPTPATPPVPSPEGLTPASSSPSPSSVPSPPSPLSPSISPGSSPGGGGSSAGAPNPTSGNTPSDIRSPTGSPPGSSATPAFTPSAFLFSTVSLLLCGLVIFI